jgi:hypothetical protein
VLGEYGTHRPASTAAVASSRTPNIAFSNGGYTVAQLLEDVNEVVPLETEPSVFDAEFSGQWGLEDYVVEVAGSECLHFMEVDGLLRDGDEVVYVHLQAILISYTGLTYPFVASVPFNWQTFGPDGCVAATKSLPRASI